MLTRQLRQRFVMQHPMEHRLEHRRHAK